MVIFVFIAAPNGVGIIGVITTSICVMLREQRMTDLEVGAGKICGSVFSPPTIEFFVVFFGGLDVPFCGECVHRFCDLTELFECDFLVVVVVWLNTTKKAWAGGVIMAAVVMMT